MGYGEKALTFAGLEDGDSRASILMTLACVYAKSAQTAEKAKTYANQLIQIAGRGQGQGRRQPGRLERPHRGRPLHHRPGRGKPPRTTRPRSTPPYRPTTSSRTTRS